MSREEMLIEQISNYFHLKENVIKIGIILENGTQIERYS